MDMVRSLGLIVLIIAAMLIFVPALVHPSSRDKYPAVDISDYLTGFHEVTGESALVPDLHALPGWKPTAATLTGPARAEHLRIGFSAPGAKYAGLEESVTPSTQFIRATLGAAGTASSGTVRIGGTRWSGRMSNDGEYALSRAVGPVTVIVTGSATVDQLRTLAGSLS